MREDEARTTADMASARAAGTGVWTGTGARATFTWLHVPRDGRARGLVVLAPPVGREHVQSYRVLRQLALLLVDAGCCVARVSYRGVGDSHALSTSDDLLVTWEQNILEAATQAREVCGITDQPVYGIGYRVGAGLLTRVAEHFEHVIAWEPVSGATFVKQWSRLRRATLPEIPVGEGVDFMGLWLTGAQAAQLSSLPDPRKIEQLPANVRIHRESDQPRAKVMYGVDSLDVRVHYDVLEDLVRLVPRGESTPLSGAQPGPVRNDFHTPEGVACAEEIVAVTAGGYPGILTGPVDAGSRAGEIGPRPGKPVTYFAPGASEPRDGSALGSETARRLAGQGVASLRADREGAGDRAMLWSDRDPNPYRYLNAQALREQARWLTERFHTDVVATVLCSGAWATLRAAREPAGLPVHGMILINQNEWRMKQEFFDQLRLTYDGDATLLKRAAASSEAGAVPAGRISRVTGTATAWLRPRLRSVKDAAAHVLRNRTPQSVWNVMARNPAASIPDDVLERASRDRRVVLLVGPQDAARYRDTMSDRAVLRLRVRGRDIRDRFVPEVDHSVLSRTARNEIARQLDDVFAQWKVQ